MPIHSFFCKKCGTGFELLVNVTTESFGEKPKCEQCGSSDLARTFSNFAVSSYGSGGCKNDSCGITHNSPGCCPGCKIK